MRCHYENIKGVGRVLIPTCWAVVISGDIELCTCKPTSYESFERERYNKEVKRLKGIIEGLEEENEHYRQLLDKVVIDE